MQQRAHLATCAIASVRLRNGRKSRATSTAGRGSIFEFNPNVAPTETVPALIAGDGAAIARFGINKLLPNGKPRAPLLNVRTDGLRKGPLRAHMKERRCVIPAAGFYEWREEGGKQPYYFARRDAKPLMLAGIWEEAEYKGDRRIAFAGIRGSPDGPRHEQRAGKKPRRLRSRSRGGVAVGPVYPPAATASCKGRGAEVARSPFRLRPPCIDEASPCPR